MLACPLSEFAAEKFIDKNLGFTEWQGDKIWKIKTHTHTDEMSNKKMSDEHACTCKFLVEISLTYIYISF